MKKILKWIGISVATLAGAALLAAAVLIFLGGRKFTALRTLPADLPIAVAVPSDAAAIARGEHLAHTRCVFCHGQDLAGKKFIEDASFMLLDAPNLTHGVGGVGASYADDAAWVRAIRHGVNSRGRALIIMPAEIYYFLSDEDLGSLIAYLKTMPPIDRSWPAPRPSLLAKALLGAGILDGSVPFLAMDHRAPRPAKPPAGATAENGEYIVRTFGCRNCHGPALSGQLAPDGSGLVAPNLTPGGSLKDWSEQNFLEMVAEQDSKSMPWIMLRAMTEDEQRALYRYLHALPALASTPAPKRR